ncbi:MAG: hypothetical protein WC326_13020 [Candidatus Delongbacteria bacterium]
MTTNYTVTYTATGAHNFTAHVFPSNFAIHLGRGLHSFPSSHECDMVEQACRWLNQPGNIACGVNLENDWTVTRTPEAKPTDDGMLLDARHLKPQGLGLRHKYGLVYMTGSQS